MQVMRRVYEFGAAAGLLILFVVLAGTSARQESATIDEFAHLAVGVHAWKTHDFSLYGKTPPTGRMLLTLPAYLLDPVISTTALQGVGEDDGWRPWIYGTAFMYQNSGVYPRLLMAARAMTILVGAGIGFGVWWWSRRWYGAAGGLTSLGGYALCPTLLAHTHLVTTDVIAGGAVLLLAGALVSYLGRPTAVRAALIGGAAGLATLVKFSTPVFAGFALAGPALAYFYPGREYLERPLVRHLLGHLALIVYLPWLVVVIGYLGRDVSLHRVNTPASKMMARAWPVVKNLPLPTEFVKGMDAQLLDAETSEFQKYNYLLGEWYSGNRWYYYPVALGAKEPVALLAFVVAAGVLALARKRRVEELMLLAMVVVFFAVTSLTSALQIGVRYLVAAYPPALVLVGKVGATAFAGGAGKGRWRPRVGPALVGAGMVWLLGAALWTWPHYLAYFSPAAGGPSRGDKILLDSNLDWGQDLPGLSRWMKANRVGRIDLAYFGHEDPVLRGINYDLPAHGGRNRYTAVSAQLLLGRRYPFSFFQTPVTQADPVWDAVGRYRGRKPAAVIGYSIFVFDNR
jgi:hypothetical protein